MAATPLVDVRRLLDYCLNTEHPRGRNKARVFATVGINRAHAEELRAALLQAANTTNAQLGVSNICGQRYFVDFELDRPGQVVRIRSTWIVRTGEDLPRLRSCYVL